MLTIGVDLGGTSIKALLVRHLPDFGEWQLLEERVSDTDAAKGREAVLDNVVAAFGCFGEKEKEESALCLSSAGTIDWDSGEVTYATDALPRFTGLKLSAELGRRMQTRVVVINDAAAALIGEAWSGAGKELERPLMLTLGTGLGSALLNDRDLNCGSVSDLHFGHVQLYKGGRMCLCGKRGCIERYVSASALKIAGGVSETLGARKGEAAYAARQVFLANFAKAVDIAAGYSPDGIIVGGGVIECAQLWWKDALAACGENAKLLIKAELGNKAGAVGACVARALGKFARQ